MRSALLIMALATPACARPLPSNQPPVVEMAMDALTRGAERMGAHDHAGALVAFQRCAQIAPTDDRCPYNGGLAAYLDGKFTIAAEQWKRA